MKKTFTTSNLSLEQVMMEHSGASTEVFIKSIEDWKKEHPDNNFGYPLDQQLGLGDYQPNMPKCCQRCPNNKNAFCNCVLPSQEMITY